MEFRLQLKYICNGSEKSFSEGEVCEDFAYRVRRGDALTAYLTPTKPITLTAIEAVANCSLSDDDRILLNAYQSWSSTREMCLSEKQTGILNTPKLAVKHYSLNRYGDYDFANYSKQSGEFHGFSYGYIRRQDGNIELIGSLNEKNGFTQIIYSHSKGTLTISKECPLDEIFEETEILNVAILQGSDDEVFDRWFELMGINKPSSKPLTGYTSWYNRYQNISEASICEDLEGIKALTVKPSVFQIDDGYETFVGDWLDIDSKKFPSGIDGVVSKISEAGMVPGLWISPFICEKKSKLFRTRKDWLLKDKNGEPVRCGCNWSGFYALDWEREDVKAYIREVFNNAKSKLGFRFFKLDFLYAACIIPRNGKTRGQLMCEAIALCREAAGDALILGCGVPLWPCFGKMEYCRIGCDVGLDWNDNIIMQQIHSERVSTRNSVLNTIYRRQLNGRAFMNDPDVFFLRKNNIKLTEKEKTTLASINGLFGGLLFMSDNAAEYGKEQMAQYEKITALGKKAENIKVCCSMGKTEVEFELEGKTERVIITY